MFRRIFISGFYAALTVKKDRTEFGCHGWLIDSWTQGREQNSSSVSSEKAVQLAAVEVFIESIVLLLRLLDRVRTWFCLVREEGYSSLQSGSNAAIVSSELISATRSEWEDVVVAMLVENGGFIRSQRWHWNSFHWYYHNIIILLLSYYARDSDHLESRGSPFSVLCFWCRDAWPLTRLQCFFIELSIQNRKTHYCDVVINLCVRTRNNNNIL